MSARGYEDRGRGLTLSKFKLILPALAHHDGVGSVEFSPDGRILLTGSLDRTVGLWAARDHRPLNPNGILRQSARVTCARFAPDGHRVIIGCTDGTVRIWDLAAAIPVTQVLTNAFSGDATAYLACSDEGFQVHSTTSNQALSPLIKVGEGLGQAQLSQNGRFVLTTSTNQQQPLRVSFEIRQSATGTRVGSPILLTNLPHLIELNVPTMRLLLAAGSVAQTWDIARGTRLGTEVEHPGTVRGAAFSRDGTLVATWAGNTVQVWNPLTGKPQFPALSHPFPVTHAEFSANGAFLVTCGADTGFNKCFAQVWDANTGRPAGPRLYHSDGVVWASVSPAGRHLTTAGEALLG